MGKKVLLWANYFQLTPTGDLALYRYTFEVTIDGGGNNPKGKKVKQIVQLFLQEHLQAYQNEIATDFKSTLVSRQKFDVWPEGYPVAYRNELEDDPAPNAKQYRVKVQYTNTLTVSELVDHLTSSQASSVFGSKEEVIQALNIIVGHHPKIVPPITNVGANRHCDRNPEPKDTMSLGAGLQAIRGFFVSVRAATARILVNVQVKNIAFYQEGPLDRLMGVYRQHTGGSVVDLAKFMKKLSVDVTHITRKNKRGQNIPRVKTIQNLATRDDGTNLEHRPQVPQFGAGSKEVKFWLDSAGQGASEGAKDQGSGKKGKKAPKPASAPSSQGKYISVYDFFKQSKCRSLPR